MGRRIIKTMTLFRGCWAPILAYIEQQFDAYLEGETRVQRVEVINTIVNITIIVTINTINTIIIIIITNIIMLRSRILWSMPAFTS